MADIAEREAGVIAGPRFDRDADGNETFTHVIDGANRVGPRPATDDDRKAHPGAYEQFKSRKPEPSSDSASKAEIARLTGELETARGDMEGLQRDIDALKAENAAMKTERETMLANASVDSLNQATAAEDPPSGDKKAEAFKRGAKAA